MPMDAVECDQYAMATYWTSLASEQAVMGQNCSNTCICDYAGVCYRVFKEYDPQDKKDNTYVIYIPYCDSPTCKL